MIPLHTASPNTDLTSWLEQNRGQVEDEISRHGAVRMRGFDVLDAPAFERAFSVICPDIFLDNGEHNRETLSGSVATPVFYPETEKVLWHCENSFNHEFPRLIGFACVVAAQSGGETPLVDNRAMLEVLDREFVSKALDKKIRYTRNYQDGFGLSWQQTFRVETRAEAEDYCRRNRISFAWEGDLLKTSMVRDAILAHPETGEHCWFAQPTHWHPYFLSEEVREVLLDEFGEDGLPRHCHWGDGSPISVEELDALAAAFTQLEDASPWQPGDCVLVDNVAVAHARNPFQGPRKLLVCMGGMHRATG